MNGSELQTARTLLQETSVQMAIERVRAEARLRSDPSEVAWLELMHTVIAAHKSMRRKFPKTREVGRVGDMAPADKGHLRVLLDSDGDAIVQVWDAHSHGNRFCSATIEFCAGGAGGGQSPRTRDALVQLMVAMELDNQDHPRGQFPPVRRAAA